MLKPNTPCTEHSLEKLSPLGDAWTIPLSSSKRDLAIETALFGTAIGEAFGAKFEGASPKLARWKLKAWKDTDIESRFPSRHALMTFISISAGQALLECRSNPAYFSTRFRRRVWCHWFARLIPTLAEAFLPGAAPVSRKFRSGPMNAADRFMPAMVFMSAILQGTTNRITMWAAALLEGGGVKDGSAPELAGFVKLVARCSQAAIFHSLDQNFDAHVALRWLSEGANESVVTQWLEAARESLDQGDDLAAFSNRIEAKFGPAAAGDDPRFVAISAIYVWLQHPTAWKDGLVEAASLGGHTTARCSIYSGLAALTTDGDCLALRVVEGHHWWPISGQWLNNFIFRLLQWPHGESDLVAAHAVRAPVIGTALAHPIVGTRIWVRRILNRCLSLFGGK